MSTTAGSSVTQTVIVRGSFLNGNITATLDDANGVYSIDKTSITASAAQANGGVTLTITYNPNEFGVHDATITLSSLGADDVIITINGVAKEKTEYVYELTSTLTAGKQYLIVNSDATGSRYALGHSGTTVATDAVTVKNDNYVADANYIEESDVNSTSIWTTASGYTFKNGNYYLGTSGTALNGSLSISTSSSNWSWDSSNNQLSAKIGLLQRTYYLRYNSNTFSINTSANSVYLYQKTEKKKHAKIAASPTSLDFDTTIGEPVTLTLNILAANITDDVTVNLSDENGVFEVSTVNISVADAENGKAITVTFNPSVFGEYTGTITLSSTNADDVVIPLNGYAREYFDVKISEAGLTTLYLDYPVEIPYDEYDPDILGVYYIIDIGTSKPGAQLQAARLDENIPAFTGVIVQGNSNTEEVPVYRFPRIKEAKPLKYDSYLSGSTVNTTVQAVLAETPGILYTLGRGSDSFINFYRYSGKNLAANKAFLLVPNTTNAKSFSVIFDDETTAIKTIDTVVEDDAWYTLEGIKLQGKPTVKGMYIHNGKSVVVK